MADDLSKWGVGAEDVAGPPVDTAPSKGLSESDFNSKWGLSEAPPAQPSVQSPATVPAQQPFGWQDTWPVRLAKTIASGLTLPGDVYQGNMPVDVSNPQFMGRVNALAGTIGTGAIPSVMSKAEPVIDPATAQLADLARNKYGIPIRGGQISESRPVNVLDSVLQGKPFSGYSENVAEQHTAFNRAVAKTLGEDADKITPEVMDAAKKRLGQNYEDIAANTTLKYDAPMHQRFNDIFNESSSVLAPSEHQIINNQLKNVLGKVDENGEVDGKTFQSILRTGSPLDRATKSPDTNVKFYAGQIKQTLLDAMERHAPDDMQALLKNTNSQYKAMKTIEDLVEKSPTGDLSPALLMGAVRKSYSNMAYGGGGELGDLARIGQRFLKEPPNSFTADRLSAMKILGLGGAGAGEAMLAFQNPIMAAKIALLGGTAMAGKALANKAAGSLLRSDWYANKLINRSLPNRGPMENMLQRLQYTPPAVAVAPNALTVQPQAMPLLQYNPQNFL